MIHTTKESRSASEKRRIPVTKNISVPETPTFWVLAGLTALSALHEFMWKDESSVTWIFYAVCSAMCVFVGLGLDRKYNIDRGAMMLTFLASSLLFVLALLVVGLILPIFN